MKFVIWEDKAFLSKLYSRPAFDKTSELSQNDIMTKSRMNPKVDEYSSKAKKWQEEFEKLRMIILDCQLTEELKTSFFIAIFQRFPWHNSYSKYVKTRIIYITILSGRLP